MANLALNKFATASGSVLPFSPSRAVDGSLAPTSRWVCGAALPHWMAVDLGNPYWINRWVVAMMGCAGWMPNYNMSSFKLQGSLDGNTWFDIDTVTGNTQNRTDRSFGPRKVKSIRVWTGQGISINNRVTSIVELEAYEAPDGPYLSNLVLSGGTLNPVFNSKVFAYSMTVSSSTQNTSVTPTAASANSVIKVNGTTVTSGQSVVVTVPAGGCQINVEVASAGMTDTYTINVTKEVKSDYLSNLVVTGLRGPMSPPFAKETYAYTGAVAGTVSSVKVTPTAEDSQAIITVAGVSTTSGAETTVNLSAGENPIAIVVQASDYSHSRTYTVTVTRPS